MREGLRYRLAGRVGQVMLDAVMVTLRYEVRGDAAYRRLLDAREPVIYALWHGRLLPLTYIHRRLEISPVISESADGEYIARILEHWDYRPVRGSSTRGGSRAFRELLRVARSGRSLAFTPDGPRGPRQRMKPGVISAAQLTGFPVVPMSAAATRAWWFEGWDRFLVPQPFARVHVAYGEPMFVPRDSSAAELERLAEALELELNRLTAAADARAAGLPEPA